MPGASFIILIFCSEVWCLFNYGIYRKSLIKHCGTYLFHRDFGAALIQGAALIRWMWCLFETSASQSITLRECQSESRTRDVQKFVVYQEKEQIQTFRTAS